MGAKCWKKVRGGGDREEGNGGEVGEDGRLTV